jgi:hypothetical protein
MPVTGCHSVIDSPDHREDHAAAEQQPIGDRRLAAIGRDGRRRAGGPQCGIACPALHRLIFNSNRARVDPVFNASEGKWTRAVLPRRAQTV